VPSVRSPRTVVALAVVLTVVLTTLAACGPGDNTAGGGSEGPNVVVTTSILADVVGDLVGEDGSVTVLMPSGTDPHEFEPSARQRAALGEADLVVANGLGLEEGLVDALDMVRQDGVEVVEVAELVDPIPFGEAGTRAGSDDGTEDPHFWLDPTRMAAGVVAIGDALTSLDDSVDWAKRAQALESDLLALDAEVEAIVDVVPPASRKLVTNHDALGYFAARYGFEVVGVVVPGGSTLAEPSAGDLEALARTIEDEDVSAIFAENTQPTDLADALASETGIDVEVVELYTGALGEPGSGADTYARLIRTDATRVADALS